MWGIFQFLLLQLVLTLGGIHLSFCWFCLGWGKHGWTMSCHQSLLRWMKVPRSSFFEMLGVAVHVKVPAKDRYCQFSHRCFFNKTKTIIKTNYFNFHIFAAAINGMRKNTHMYANAFFFQCILGGWLNLRWPHSVSLVFKKLVAHGGSVGFSLVRQGWRAMV